MPAAIREPTNQDALNIDVMIGRSFGYESSPSIAEPDTMQNTIPNPRIIRAESKRQSYCLIPEADE